MKLYLLLLTFFSLNFYSMDNLLEKKTKSKGNKFSGRVTNFVFSNFYKPESSQSNFFLFSLGRLNYKLSSKYTLNFGISNVKKLEDYKENFINDLRLGTTLLNIKLTDKLSYSLRPELRYTLHENLRKQYYQRGIIRLTNSFSYGLSKKITLFANPRFQKFSHKYKTNFFGGSNSSFWYSLTIATNYQILPKLGLYAEYDWRKPYTYRGNGRDTIGSLFVNLGYQIHQKIKLNAGISSENQILNDIGETRKATDYILTDRTLFYGGIDVIF